MESYLGIKLRDEIIACYRIGKKNLNNSRAILLKLSNNHIKQEIYNTKKKLKGSGIIIKEDLTENRLRMMEAAIDKTTLRSVWSYEGTVYALKNGKRFAIRGDSDLLGL
nr:unnamed protein product [Callosobruchus analis]